MEGLISLLSSIAEKFLGYFFRRYNTKYIHDKKIAEQSLKIFPEEIKNSLVNHYFEGVYFLKHNEYVVNLISFQEKQENQFFDTRLNHELMTLVKKLGDVNYFHAIHNDTTQLFDVYKLSDIAIEKGAQEKLDNLTTEFEKAYEIYRDHLKKKFFI